MLGENDTWKHIEEKVDDYHEFGVDIVWVADPKTQSVRVYPKGRKPHVCHGDDELDGGKVLPGMCCKVSEFFVA